jgi:hypothetical protein
MTISPPLLSAISKRGDVAVGIKDLERRRRVDGGLFDRGNRN